jgi:hypothetical protein
VLRGTGVRAVNRAGASVFDRFADELHATFIDSGHRWAIFSRRHSFWWRDPIVPAVHSPRLRSPGHHSRPGRHSRPSHCSFRDATVNCAPSGSRSTASCEDAPVLDRAPVGQCRAHARVDVVDREVHLPVRPDRGIGRRLHRAGVNTSHHVTVAAQHDLVTVVVDLDAAGLRGRPLQDLPVEDGGIERVACVQPQEGRGRQSCGGRSVSRWSATFNASSTSRRR